MDFKCETCGGEGKKAAGTTEDGAEWSVSCPTCRGTGYDLEKMAYALDALIESNLSQWKAQRENTPGPAETK